MDLRTLEFRRRHLPWQIPILECKRLIRRLRQHQIEMCTLTLECPTRRLRQDQLEILTLATRVISQTLHLVIGQKHLVTDTLPRAIELFCVLTKILPSHNAFPPKNTRANRVFQYSSTIVLQLYVHKYETAVALSKKRLKHYMYVVLEY